MKLKRKLGLLAAGAAMVSTSIFGCSSPTDPSRPEDPPLPTEHIEEQSETTDSSGIATFNDDGTEVKVEVLTQEGTSILNANVEYRNGPNNTPFDAFVISANGFHPEPFFTIHDHSKSNIFHTIRLMGENVGNWAIENITGTSDIQAITNYLNYYLPQASTHAGAGVFYTGTRTAEEIGDAHSIGLNTSLFLASSATGAPIIKVVSSATHLLPLEQLISEVYEGSSKNWDTYRISWLRNGDFTVDVESGKPSLYLHPPTTTPLGITINGQTTDLNRYFNMIPDPTNRILGTTSNFDPIFSRKIIKNYSNGEHAIMSEADNIQAPFPWTLSSLSPGNYTIEIEVMDDTRLNKATAERDFTVESQENVTLQPGPEEGNDTYITRLVTDQGDLNIDLNSGQSESLLISKHDITAQYDLLERKAMVSFDIPSGEVLEAKLHLLGDDMSFVTPSGFTVYCHEVDGSWDESTATHRNSNELIGDLISTTQIEHTLSGENRWFEFDVTDSVKKHLEDKTFLPYGCALISSYPGGMQAYSSEHPNPEFRPKLTITYQDNQ